MTGQVAAGRGGRGNGRGHLILVWFGADLVTSPTVTAIAWTEDTGRNADARKRCLIVRRGESA